MPYLIPSDPVWSFFSGAYGLDLGLEQAGLNSQLAVELDHDCCETLRQNRPELRVLERDVSTLTAKELREITGHDGEVFALVGGPPCQSFSTGGKRAGLQDPRGNLVYEYLRLVKEVRPRFFVLENVANIITAALKHRPIDQRPGKHWSLKRYSEGSVSATDAPALDEEEMAGSAIRQILDDVRALGYLASFGILNAADFGAPQARMRFVLIGSRDAQHVPLPEPTHGPSSKSQTPYVTVRDAIGDLVGEPGVHSSYTPEVRRFFDHVPVGGNWRMLPPEMQREALGKSFDAGGGKTGFFRRLAWDTPAPTIVGRPNRKGSALCHPEASRPISVKECARLQGFPDDWTLSGSMSSQYLQVGNAVPVALGHAIGRALLDAASRTTIARKIFPTHDEMMAVGIAHLRSKARNKVGQRHAAKQQQLWDCANA